jgi:XTP/dITP diphosphohydrolase
MIVTAATTNSGKLRELSEVLGSRLRLVPAPEPYRAPLENGANYRENARIKARALFDTLGSSALADDSGLEVDALDGRPGVHSARYGTEAADRNRRLLDELRGRVGAERRARFRTAIVLILADGRELTADGHCEGQIAEAPRGAEGFGYDPVFLLPALGRTLAELTSEEKNRFSARAEAARALLRELDRLGIWSRSESVR